MELTAGIEEDIRPAGALLKAALPLGHGFDGAAAGGAHGDDPPASLFCFVDQVCGRLGHVIVFRVHFVVLDIFHAHRPNVPSPT